MDNVELSVSEIDDIIRIELDNYTFSYADVNTDSCGDLSTDSISEYEPADNETSESSQEECIPESTLNVPSTSTNYEKILTRKRKVDEASWKRKQKKDLRSAGEEYISTNGNIIASKMPKPVNCKCHWRCLDIFTEEEILKINKEYWGLKDYQSQRHFIASQVETVKCRRKLVTSSRRNATYIYILNEKRVCKGFFLTTLNISDGALMTVKLKERAGLPYFVDNRGKCSNPHKISEEMRSLVKDHINSFPSVESHYVRRDSTRMYLASDLNIKKMYQLFTNINPETRVKESLYRKIFCTEFNYSFHIPKKDTCRVCEIYRISTNKEELQEGYDIHQANKESARNSKERDKLLAKNDPTIKVFTFDLQSVLNSPCSNVSSFYFSRKFSSYNLTFYDLATADGFCYYWNETDGLRGSDEIGSIIYKHLALFQEGIKKVILYSDCCGGQNRNRFVVALLAYINFSMEFESIELKFPESGHTQMEVDSMHSAIEKAKKNTLIYTPNEWPTILRTARRCNPYKIDELDFTSFYDLKALLNSLKNDLKKNSNNDVIPWMKVKNIRLTGANKNIIEYKTDWSGDFYQINITKNRTNRVCVPIEIIFKRKYEESLPISAHKAADLKKLCSQGLIPLSSATFYNNLKVKNGLRNCLSEPNYDEDED